MNFLAFRWWTTTLCLALLLGCLPIQAQETVGSGPLPYGVVYAQVGERLVALERHRGQHVSQPPVRGFSQSFLTVPGTGSPRVLSTADEVSFVVTYRIDASDPMGVQVQQLDPLLFELHRLTKQKGERRLILSLRNLYQESRPAGVFLEPYPQSDNVLRLVPAERLTPGEYAVVYAPRSGSAQLFCFSVVEGSRP